MLRALTVVRVALAAALASEWLMALLRALVTPTRSAGRPAGPRLMNAPRGSVPFAIVSGTFVFGPAYGMAFEWLARADLEAGAVMGAIHGALAGTLVMLGLMRRRRRDGTSSSVRGMILYRVRRFATRILYGAFIGLLYVVPGS